MSLTQDAFLGGRLHLWQPRTGYRAGIDPVLLAAAVPAKAGQSVLDLGCGVGTALLCLGRRVPGLTLTGVDLLPDYAALARRNAAEAGLAAEVVTADVGALPPDLRARTFDQVLTNPPYFRAGQRSAAPDPGREAGRAEALPLADWLDAALRRVAPNGRLTLIQHIDRLPEILSIVSPRLGALTVLPIAPRKGRPAGLALVTGAKGRKAPFCLLNPLILHEGAQHGADSDRYRPDVSAVLRDMAPLPLAQNR